MTIQEFETEQEMEDAFEKSMEDMQEKELAPQVNPDSILMDVRMPRMTGYEACRIIKLNPNLTEIPIVFLSAKGQETEIQQGLEAGAEEYLFKAFAPDQLTTHVKTILAKFGK